MDKDLIVLIMQLVLAIGSFLAGRYLLPKYKTNINTAVTQFDVVLKYAESFVAWARQFLNSSGEDKMNDVVKKLKAICDKEGIDLDEETLKAIAQKAYDAMIAAEKKAKIVVETPVVEEAKTFEPIDSETACSEANVANTKN